MAKEELLEFPGVVTELLPNATFRVKLENEHEIIAHTAGRIRKNRIRVLAGDKVLAVGRRVLPTPELVDEASQCLRMLSGRNHRVHTGICLVTPKEAYRQRLVETRVRFKRLSEDDIETYLASGEWRGKAGGYAAQSIAGSLIRQNAGSYTNVVALPLYEVTTLLSGEGYPIPVCWL